MQLFTCLNSALLSERHSGFFANKFFIWSYNICKSYNYNWLISCKCNRHLIIFIFRKILEKLEITTSYQRLNSEETRVVFAGESGCGKSTLINAIVGHSILPTGGGESGCTSAIVEIKKKPNIKFAVISGYQKIFEKIPGFMKTFWKKNLRVRKKKTKSQIL